MSRITTAIRAYLAVYRYTWRAVALVWTTNRGLTLAFGLLTVVAGLLPAGVAYTGKLIVDGVLLAARTGLADHRWEGLGWVALEAGLVAGLAAAQRGLDVIQQLLRARLGHQVHVLILDKALRLDLARFEDSEFYDKLTRARREASTRPLSLVKSAFGLAQNTIALSTFAVLLLQFSPWAVAVLALGAIPAFIAETKFAGKAFTLFRWKSPETRKQVYLEVLMAREDHAKEVKLLQLGPLLIRRYEGIFDDLYVRDRRLAVQRGIWGFALGLFSTAALYGAYAWIAVSAIAGAITLGGMTMYLLLFKQGASSFSAILSSIGGMYEDNLYLSNLYEYLEEPESTVGGTATSGPSPEDGIRFEDVTFRYPGSERPAVQGVNLHLRPGEKLALVGPNGSGKTTLIKLLTRLYVPQSGRILLDGRDLQQWEDAALRKRIGVIFQDFVRYQFTLGENIGVGDVEHLQQRERWQQAAEQALAGDFVEELPKGYDTQLGRWFEDGRELSLGQWQKVALARAFMHDGADILVLDEPTAAIDAEAEARLFERFRDMTADKMAILISHRFSTVRVADAIVVLDGGRVVETGSHPDLMAQQGLYERLFSLQAAGYR